MEEVKAQIVEIEKRIADRKEATRDDRKALTKLRNALKTIESVNAK